MNSHFFTPPFIFYNSLQYPVITFYNGLISYSYSESKNDYLNE